MIACEVMFTEQRADGSQGFFSLVGAACAAQAVQQ